MSSTPGQRDAQISARRETILTTRLQALHERTDCRFAVLMGLQWVAGIAAAMWVSPRTWTGLSSSTHVHVYAAIFLGGGLASLPICLVVTRRGKPLTRHVIAVAQMLTSALLIHLTGGRIETHFHIFGSLAFLSCYRDWRILVSAAVVVAADHWIRGVYWPESVYGVLASNSWRLAEHVGWVVFELAFLIPSLRQSLREMRDIAEQQAMLEMTCEVVEAEVDRRTKDLNQALKETADAKGQLEDAVHGLTRRNRDLDEFTYVASHDLQEPVRKLVSFSSLLEKDLGEDLNPRAKEDLGFITDAAYRMQNLIQDLLALSRAGRKSIKFQNVSLETSVGRALDSLELRVGESGAEIRRDPLPSVCGDATLLTQVYQNLIGNALKFVSCENPLIHITAEQDGDRFILGVRDNGIGIEAGHYEQIFLPFKRLHGRGEYEGTGVGLAICQKVVELHGGTLWVESEPGQGSHFRFTLAPRPSEPGGPDSSVAEGAAVNTNQRQPAGLLLQPVS